MHYITLFGYIFGKQANGTICIKDLRFDYQPRLSVHWCSRRNGTSEKCDWGKTSRPRGRIDGPPRAVRRTWPVEHPQRIPSEVESRRSCADALRSYATWADNFPRQRWPSFLYQTKTMLDVTIRRNCCLLHRDKYTMPQFNLSKY